MKTCNLILNNTKIEILYEDRPQGTPYNESWAFFHFYIKDNLELYSYDKQEYINHIKINKLYLTDIKEFSFSKFYVESGILEKTISDMEGYDRYRMHIIVGWYGDYHS